MVECEGVLTFQKEGTKKDGSKWFLYRVGEQKFFADKREPLESYEGEYIRIELEKSGESFNYKGGQRSFVPENERKYQQQSTLQEDKIKHWEERDKRIVRQACLKASVRLHTVMVPEEKVTPSNMSALVQNVKRIAREFEEEVNRQ